MGEKTYKRVMRKAIREEVNNLIAAGIGADALATHYNTQRAVALNWICKWKKLGTCSPPRKYRRNKAQVTPVSDQVTPVSDQVTPVSDQVTPVSDQADATICSSITIIVPPADYQKFLNYCERECRKPDAQILYWIRRLELD